MEGTHVLSVDFWDSHWAVTSFILEFGDDRTGAHGMFMKCTKPDVLLAFSRSREIECPAAAGLFDVLQEAIFVAVKQEEILVKSRC